MLDHFKSEITFAIPTNMDFQTMAMSSNYTVLLTGIEDFNKIAAAGKSKVYNTGSADADYQRFIGDVWVGIVLTLMIVTSIFCMCSCFLYHKFRQWKSSGE